ncbi:hypothetical protein Bca4012_074033 [Brassica carinata]
MGGDSSTETTWEEVRRRDNGHEGDAPSRGDDLGGDSSRRDDVGGDSSTETTWEEYFFPVRGVAVPGVEGEPVSLPEPATEAIAAAFGQWLLHKKNVGSRKLRVSVGHDSRISAPTLLEAVSRGLGLSGLDVVQSAAVDSSGREFNRNRLIALLSAIFLEQIRVSGFGGWFLLRLSLHDPFLPLNIEAQSEDDAVKLGLVVANAVKEFNALDTSALSSLTRS